MLKTTKANPPLTYAEKIGPQCLMLLPSHPAYQLRWSNDDEVWSISLILLYHTARQKAKPGSASDQVVATLADVFGLDDAAAMLWRAQVEWFATSAASPR
jgi:hypothetical protein